MNLSTSIWAIVTCYLQLHSWVDCIEPLDSFHTTTVSVSSWLPTEICVWMYSAISLHNNILTCPKYSAGLLKIAAFQTHWSEKRPAAQVTIQSRLSSLQLGGRPSLIVTEVSADWSLWHNESSVVPYSLKDILEKDVSALCFLQLLTISLIAAKAAVDKLMRHNQNVSC